MQTSSAIFMPAHTTPSYLFNDTATTEIYTLSLHDALPIYRRLWPLRLRRRAPEALCRALQARRSHRRLHPLLHPRDQGSRSEEHTSELQSQSNLVCRLLLEKKKHQLT